MIEWLILSLGALAAVLSLMVLERPPSKRLTWPGPRPIHGECRTGGQNFYLIVAGARPGTVRMTPESSFLLTTRKHQNDIIEELALHGFSVA